MINTDTW